MSDDVILNLSHHVGKQVASVHVKGDLEWYQLRGGNDDGLESLVVTFTDGTRLVASFWTSEMGAFCIDEGAVPEGFEGLTFEQAYEKLKEK